jgi:hypothetical protein
MGNGRSQLQMVDATISGAPESSLFFQSGRAPSSAIGLADDVIVC